MNKPMFKVGTHDFFKGAITAVFTGVIVTMYSLVTQADFNVFTADWGSILNDVFNVGLATFFGYVGKNLFSDEEGNFAGIK